MLRYILTFLLLSVGSGYSSSLEMIRTFDVVNQALGGADVAASGISSAINNPAALGGMNSHSASLSYHSWIDDTSLKNINMAGYWPYFAINAFFTGFSTSAFPIYDSRSLYLGTASPSSCLAGIGLAITFPKSSLFSLGCNLQVGFTSFGTGAELDSIMNYGIQIRLMEKKLVFGASLNDHNLNEKENNSQKLPGNIRIGADWKFLSLDLVESDLYLQLSKEKKYGSTLSASVGSEIKLMEKFKIRMGYDFDPEASIRFSTGLGIVMKRMEVSYVYIPVMSLGSVHGFGIKISY